MSNEGFLSSEPIRNYLFHIDSYCSKEWLLKNFKLKLYKPEHRVPQYSLRLWFIQKPFYHYN